MQKIGESVVQGKGKGKSGEDAGTREENPSIPTQAKRETETVKLSLKDLNILGAAYQVLKRKSNVVTLTASGMSSIIHQQIKLDQGTSFSLAFALSVLTRSLICVSIRDCLYLCTNF
jgi:hypothetical protein